MRKRKRNRESVVEREGGSVMRCQRRSGEGKERERRRRSESRREEEDSEAGEEE
jgi:hypothetical protein